MIEIPNWVFVGSLALNVILVLVVGYLINKDRWDDPPTKLTTLPASYTTNWREQYYRDLPDRIEKYKAYIAELEDPAEREKWFKHVEALKVEQLKNLKVRDEQVFGPLKSGGIEVGD